jgi:DNA-directed RNA polymerase specialized sigma24 family protein
VSFETFVAEVTPRLRAGLVAAYGPETGQDALAESLAYAWEHRERLEAMDNPAGYLYRVGQTSVRRINKRHGYLPAPPQPGLPQVEPGLPGALEELSETQRTCVLLVHAFGWSKSETAELLDISLSSVRTHLSRAMEKLRTSLEVELHD